VGVVFLHLNLLPRFRVALSFLLILINKQPQSAMTDATAPCPVCWRSFPLASIHQHANQCIDLDTSSSSSSSSNSSGRPSASTLATRIRSSARQEAMSHPLQDTPERYESSRRQTVLDGGHHHDTNSHHNLEFDEWVQVPAASSTDADANVDANNTSNNNRSNLLSQFKGTHWLCVVESLAE
jgi:hypothetical protein